MLNAAGIVPGDKVAIEARPGELVMELIDEPMTLEELLTQSPKESFKIIEEDTVWVDASPRGHEI